eukprot:Skav234879  [mRNA]  locus=scaffold840:371446:378465:- [translate_table: standard]
MFTPAVHLPVPLRRGPPRCAQLLYDKLLYEEQMVELPVELSHRGEQPLGQRRCGVVGGERLPHRPERTGLLAPLLVIVASCALEQPDAQEILAELRAELAAEPSAGQSAGESTVVHQFQKAAELLGQHPETTVIIDHLGSPLMEDINGMAEQYWQGLEKLAALPQTFMKISMLSRLHLDWDQQPLVLEAVHRVIRTFGPKRCMFASNAPVDQQDDWPPSRVFKASQDLAIPGAADSAAQGSQGWGWLELQGSTW